MLDPSHDIGLLRMLQYGANVVLFGGLVVAMLAEWALPPPGYRWDLSRLAHGAHNLLLWLMGVAIMSIVFGTSVWLALFWLQSHGVGVLYLVHLPGWLHAIAAFALLDASDYIFHRLSHNVRWLWLLHAVHHSDPRVDVTTNLRQHPLHILITMAWKLVTCAAVGIPPWIFMLHEIVNLAFAHLHHAAISWPRWIDRALSWLIITPRLHWNHHSPATRSTNSNYGVIFSLWDRGFGTLTLPNAEPRPTFGLAAFDEARWHSVWGMLATPWRARAIRQL
jgi:sterol desaturase/sphingolipid hydroxylase (fatty acid hydroxylase superfamily)